MLNVPEGGLLLAEQWPEFIRDFTVALLERYVPSDTGDARFAEIAKDYGGSGTTCGYLCHWMFWRLGCRLPDLVNRSSSEDGLEYVVGRNISRIAGSTLFTRYTAGAAPERGDVFFLSNGPSATEHVGVFLGADGDSWHSADAGQTNGAGKQCARFVDRAFANGALSRSGVSRKVIGWISLLDIPLTALADLDVSE